MIKIKGKYISDIIIGLVSIVVYTALIGFVCIPFGIDPFSRGNITLWISTVMGACILKIMWGEKGDRKGKQNSNYIGWLMLTGKNMQLIRKNATLEMKKEFCENINQQQEQASILDYINENDIEELYNNCLEFKKDIGKEKNENLLNLKFLKKCNDYLIKLLKEKSITKKQKRKLIKLFKSGIKYPKITIQDLNSLDNLSKKTILYDIKNKKKSSIAKDFIYGIFLSIAFFGLISSLVPGSIEQIYMISSFIKIICIGITLIWTSWYSYNIRIAYVEKYDTSFLRRKNNLFCDFCYKNEIEFYANPQEKTIDK